MDEPTPRILFLGLHGPFSQAPLAALLAAERPVVAVVVPAEAGAREPIRRLQPPPSPSQLPLLTPYVEADTTHLAWAHGLPVFAVRDLAAPETVQVLGALQPDVGCVACFPWRLPASLLALPPHGFLNLHPSLLPAYRGPHPLFWTFRDGAQETGVTLHYMNEELDRGDIALQAPLFLPDGISGPEADRSAGEIGGELVVEATSRLAAGTLPRRPQAAGGHYYPAPVVHDFHLDTGWPARRAFNFMRGTAEWGHPYQVETNGRSFHLAQALAYRSRQRLKSAYREAGREIWLQFSPGVLHARLG